MVDAQSIHTLLGEFQELISHVEHELTAAKNDQELHSHLSLTHSFLVQGNETLKAFATSATKKAKTASHVG
jgi:hypothetical protein